MSTIAVNGQQLPVRKPLADAVAVAWDRVAQAGTWWTGSERIEIAAQVRAARHCDICRQRKEALSPYADGPQHRRTQLLSVQAVEAVHRVSTDASRITGKWIDQLIENGLSEEKYVEIVSLVATVTALDTFNQALGLEVEPMPVALPGQPTRHRPSGASRNLARVATLSPEDLNPEDPDPFAVHGSINIHRALSLVPQEVINFFDLDVELYLKDHEIRDFEHEFREISHAQIELIAGRASAINGCYY